MEVSRVQPARSHRGIDLHGSADFAVCCLSGYVGGNVERGPIPSVASSNLARSLLTVGGFAYSIFRTAALVLRTFGDCNLGALRVMDKPTVCGSRGDYADTDEAVFQMTGITHVVYSDSSCRLCAEFSA